MCPQSTLETRRQTAQHSTFGGGGQSCSRGWHKWQWCHKKQIGFGLRTLWAFFFPGTGVKSRLQCWGCMHPAPQGADKKYGALSLSLSHTHTHTVDTHTHRRHTHLLSLSSSLPFLSPSLYLQLSSQERNSLFFGSRCPCWCFILTQHKRGTDKVYLLRFGSPNTIS